MAAADYILLTILALAGSVYFFRGFLFGGKSAASKLAGEPLNGVASSDDSGGDLVQKLQKQNKRIAIFYGSQTGELSLS